MKRLRMSRWRAWGWGIVAFVLLSALSLMLPPMQSPDEHAHLMRAEMLARGQWRLQLPPSGTPTELFGLGGQVDENLALFSFTFVAIATHKNSATPAQLRQNYQYLQWANSTRFSPATGTGYYFPLIYAPQALALKLGHELDLSVLGSYQLTRSLTLLLSCALIALAVYKCAPNPAVVATLALPMCVFQVISPTLDGLTTALAALAISDFWQRVRSPVPVTTSPLLIYACLFFVVTSRIHLGPMLLLPAYLAWQQRSLRAWSGAAFLVLICLAWTVHAMISMQEVRLYAKHSASELLRIYLAQPQVMLELIWNTLQHEGRMKFYWQSFIGILGWLDTPLSNVQYQLIGASLGMSVVASWRLPNQCSDAKPRLVMIGAALGSICIAFLAMALTWTTYPAEIIEGVQGRYFLVPALLICYSLGNPEACGGKWESVWSWRTLVAASSAATSLVALIFTLHERYHFVF